MSRLQMMRTPLPSAHHVRTIDKHLNRANRILQEDKGEELRTRYPLQLPRKRAGDRSKDLAAPRNHDTPGTP
eukprot:2828432-Prorocentrum_lima.AAC.1